MYKCLNNRAHKYLSKNFWKRSNIHERQTRQWDSLQIHYTSARQYSAHLFIYRAVNYWNNLDFNLKNAKSLKSFKSEQKNKQKKTFITGILDWLTF